MAIYYQCSRCSADIGEIEGGSYHEEQLGLHTLTDQERQEMVSYGENGDVHIKAICENCQEAYDRNPDMHQYDHLIQ